MRLWKTTTLPQKPYSICLILAKVLHENVLDRVNGWLVHVGLVGSVTAGSGSIKLDRQQHNRPNTIIARADRFEPTARAHSDFVTMYHDLHFRSMNTDVTAWLWNNDAQVAARALTKVEQFFQAAHKRFTRFESNSELSALNAARGKPFAASAEMFEVGQLVVKFSELTDGWFNPTIIGALEAAGYDRTFEAITVAVDQKETSASRISAASSIVLDASRRTITLPIGVRIDLGGIVKGWAVQKATEQLALYGPCLIDAGGDMLTLGTVPGSPDWSIEIVDPFDREQDALSIHLHDRAVATSGIDRRQWQRNGQPQHHLIDPHTGLPSTSEVLTATVIAPTTIEAEIYAKTVFLLGAQAGLSFVEARPTLAACVITADNEIILSKSMQEYLNVHFTFSSNAAT